VGRLGGRGTIYGVELDDDERLVIESARLKVNYRAQADLAADVDEDQSYEYVGD